MKEGRQERCCFLSLPPLKSYPNWDLLYARLFNNSFIITSSQYKHMRQKWNFYLMNEETEAQINNLFRSSTLSKILQDQNSNPGLSYSTPWPLSLNHANCDSGFRGGIWEPESHQVPDIECPEKSEVWREKSLRTWWNESLSLHLWTDREFLLCHYPTENLNGVLFCIPFSHL